MGRYEKIGVDIFRGLKCLQAPEAFVDDHHFCDHPAHRLVAFGAVRVNRYQIAEEMARPCVIFRQAPMPGAVVRVARRRA